MPSYLIINHHPLSSLCALFDHIYLGLDGHLSRPHLGVLLQKGQQLLEIGDYSWRVVVEEALDPPSQLFLHAIQEFPRELLRYAHALDRPRQDQFALKVLKATGEVLELQAAFLQLVPDGQLGNQFWLEL